MILLIIDLVLVYRLDPVTKVGVFGHNIQNFNLVIGSLDVMTGTFLHFQSHEGIILSITGEPNS